MAVVGVAAGKGVVVGVVVAGQVEVAQHGGHRAFTARAVARSRVSAIFRRKRTVARRYAPPAGVNSVQASTSLVRCIYLRAAYQVEVRLIMKQAQTRQSRNGYHQTAERSSSAAEYRSPIASRSMVTPVGFARLVSLLPAV